MLTLEGRPTPTVLDGALALGLATGQKVTVEGPLTGADRAMVLAATKLSGIDVELPPEGPVELALQPPRAGTYRLELREPSAVHRALAAFAWPLALTGRPSELRLAGPNHVRGEPTFHDLRLAWAPWVSNFGLKARLELSQAAFESEEGELVATLDPAPALTSLHAGQRGILRQVTVVAAVAGARHDEALLAAEQVARVLRRQGVVAEVERVPLPIGPNLPARPRWSVSAVAEFESSIVAASDVSDPGPRVGGERETAMAAGERVGEQIVRFLSRRGTVDAWLAEQLLLPSLLSAAGLGARAGPPPSCHYTTTEVTQPLLELATLARLALPVRAVVDGAPGDEGVVVVAKADT